ncbi:MAG TPA: inner membrane protein YhjD [Actinophytocola sp.]|uniref:inner membrane protein YhjD n=1 Tax=Actinophytocola sp. TaxID=1872138 RepID=UPI002DDD7387|nr:inner membrane protein YhjD [Actinophytocola sp.]HEV2784130.1 inner membrane protein YhjD [Actinophytocola sp.]
MGAEDGRLSRLRRRESVNHLVRAGGAYLDRNGDHYAAAITYFSVLSLFPLLMMAFAVAGFILAGNDALLRDFQQSILENAPAGLGKTLNDVINEAIKQRGTVGVLGLLAAVYSGYGWMTNLRDALSAMWGHDLPDRSFLRKVLSDVLSLLGLGLALLISFGLTAAGSGLGSFLLRLVGLADDAWALFLLRVGTIVLALAANWLVFLWVISRLPRQRVSAKSALRGALFAAIGFEILKQLATIYLNLVGGSPTGALFGPIIGLLLFANLVARLLLFITAWTATAKENLEPAVPRPPAPAVIRPTVQVHSGPRLRDAAGLLGAGALAGLFWGRRARRH